tara:strand:- start:16 stop:297 length:282 start_codon:yes stop_codon:yes gene_type:complete
MARGKTVTIRVSEQTFDQIKSVCSDLGDTYNFNQFVNQSLSAMLEVINHDGEKVPIPKFAMMARLMKDYEVSVFGDMQGENVNGGGDEAGNSS